MVCRSLSVNPAAKPHPVSICLGLLWKPAFAALKRFQPAYHILERGPASLLLLFLRCMLLLLLLLLWLLLLLVLRLLLGCAAGETGGSEARC